MSLEEVRKAAELRDKLQQLFEFKLQAISIQLKLLEEITRTVAIQKAKKP